MTRWRELRAEAATVVGDREARFIVEEVSGFGSAEWIDAADTDPTWRQAARLRAMVDRRVQGEPLQYVLGSWSFRSLDLMVDPRVLIPRPETEWVVEIALDECVRLDLGRGAVADLGTGSGAIALALAAALPAAAVWATDVSDDALAVARANVAGCAARNVRVVAGSWFEALPAELRGELALIVSNPPYVAEHEVADLPAVVVDHEPRGALVAGPTGLEALTVVIDAAPEWLCTPGTLVCEIAPHQADAVTELALTAGFDDAFVRLDLTGRPRVLVARRG
ncbi:MAG: peptide chain release factor N(5)-glutamine methyltransferase [Actinomycetota bacterium]|nr:peptide chain release factor N(5)-glutamine methyltransferase [Actinomycetota bacterium]